MNEQLALRRAIIDEPDNDTPRLIYADWLDENGYAERAEFIRRQVSRPGETESVNELTSRRRYLREPGESLHAHSGYIFRRGFVETVACLLADWLKQGPKLLQLHPITRVRIRGSVPFHVNSGYAWFESQTPRGIWSHLIHDSRRVVESCNATLVAFDTVDITMDALNEAAFKWAKGQVKRTPELC